MFTKCYGQGERIFFGLHGWSGDHTTFAPLAKFLPPNAKIVSPDLPGYGQSPPPRAWTLDALAEELAAEIEHLNSPRDLDWKLQRRAVGVECDGAASAPDRTHQPAGDD